MNQYHQDELQIATTFLIFKLQYNKQNSISIILFIQKNMYTTIPHKEQIISDYLDFEMHIASNLST